MFENSMKTIFKMKIHHMFQIGKQNIRHIERHYRNSIPMISKDRDKRRRYFMQIDIGVLPVSYPLTVVKKFWKKLLHWIVLIGLRDWKKILFGEINKNVTNKCLQATWTFVNLFWLPLSSIVCPSILNLLVPMNPRTMTSVHKCPKWKENLWIIWKIYKY